MTVYHGGYISVENPQVRIGRNTKDFGTGFYCTVIKEQAQRWAKRYDTKVVSIYEVRLNLDLNIKEFQEMTEEWLDFIVEYNHKKNLKIVENNNTIFALEANEIMGTDGKPIINPNYETELAQKEAERISKLTCTKRNFALMLQKLGVSYSQLKEIIATNEQAQLEWDLCVELERSNPLLDTMAAELNITPETLDKMFKYVNGELEVFPEAQHNA